MLPWLNPTVWLVALAILLGAYGTGRWQQWRSDEKTQVSATLKATQDARDTESKWQASIAEQQEAHHEEIARVSAARDAALRSLRNRPASVPEAARPTAACGTGATLYRDDAELLVREAARADELRAALGSCQAWIETVTSPSPARPLPDEARHNEARPPRSN